MIQLDLSGLPRANAGRNAYRLLAREAYQTLLNGTGPGREMTGWVRLPQTYDRQEFARILQAAQEIRNRCQALVVIGIGGSYLGARAAIELLRGPDYNLSPKEGPDIFFVGNGLSTDALLQTLAAIGERDLCINVISKSGATTEPAIAFRVFRKLLETRYAQESSSRIYVTTDSTQGALKVLAEQEGFPTFTIPESVGGRYSVLSAVGLLPMAVAGVDIEALMEGAGAQMERLLSGWTENPACDYAAARQWLFGRGRTTEVLAAYEPAFHYFAEWWKQLYGESEGKDGSGIFPASVELTADLHSMGQYLQDGLRNLMETMVFFENTRGRVPIPYDRQNVDGLNYLAHKSLSEVNRAAMEATRKAHIAGGIPVMLLRIRENTERYAGALLYFFQFACGISAYMTGVNPFDQPGVEAYKRNLYTILGKPGYSQR